MLLGVPLQDRLPPLQVRMGTTRGTNALLTRGGARVGLVVTAGFQHVLEIGEQDRPELFDLTIRKPAPLSHDVIPIDERLDASGTVLHPLNPDRVRSSLGKLRDRGIRSLAICLLHSYVNDCHELAVEEIARSLGFENVSRSSEVAPLIKLVSRAETTTLDAYLNPILTGYVARVWKQFGGRHSCHLRLMTSGGNLVAPESFRGRDSILSGPAGGVVALGHIARQSNTEAAIGLDMGGTSTDVSRYEGRLGRRYETRVSGIRILTPMMDIQTVAAGGGSICQFRGGRLCVGPESAGAQPGPASYGRGGPLTVTDVNLLMGRIPEDRFPFPLDRQASKNRLQEIFVQANQIIDRDAAPESLAEGFLEIAVTHMAEAVRSVSTAEGTDVRAMTLVGFGGAAGQHLCRVADALGIQRIIDHPSAPVLSAVGMGLASIGRVTTHGVYRSLGDVSEHQIKEIVETLTRHAIQQLNDEQIGDKTPDVRVECDVRFTGTESALSLPLTPHESLADRFHSAFQKTFGYSRVGDDIELVAVRCEATIVPEPINLENATQGGSESTSAASQTQIWHSGTWIDAKLIDRMTLSQGDLVSSPAMIVSDQSTLIVEPGWQAGVMANGSIELTPAPDAREIMLQAEGTAADDPVLLEVVARRLQGIADAMGEVLRRTAVSVNVKERRDYSCAVFRGDGVTDCQRPACTSASWVRWGTPSAG